jgi:prepilin signal peptidase PulO-like enzyme (type II secretory pathway)
MLVLDITAILLFGMCFGSFITMASYRLALINFSDNISIKYLIFERSFCPNCSNKLKAVQLLPIFSWLFYRAKCKFCLQKISIRYPLIEFFTAILFLTIFLALESKIDIKLIIILLMAVILIIMLVVDLEYYFIPDITQITLVALILVYHLLVSTKHNLSYYLLSSIGFFIFSITLHYSFLFLTKKQGIGEDDLKFFAVAGFMLGIDQLILFMTLSGILGTVFGFFWIKLKKDNTFPFAPVLVVSFLIPTLFSVNYVGWLITFF